MNLSVTLRKSKALLPSQSILCIYFFPEILPFFLKFPDFRKISWKLATLVTYWVLMPNQYHWTRTVFLWKSVTYFICVTHYHKTRSNGSFLSPHFPPPPHLLFLPQKGCSLVRKTEGEPWYELSVNKLRSVHKYCSYMSKWCLVCRHNPCLLCLCV